MLPHVCVRTRRALHGGGAARPCTNLLTPGVPSYPADPFWQLPPWDFPFRPPPPSPLAVRATAPTPWNRLANRSSSHRRPFPRPTGARQRRRPRGGRRRRGTGRRRISRGAAGAPVARGGGRQVGYGRFIPNIPTVTTIGDGERPPVGPPPVGNAKLQTEADQLTGTAAPWTQGPRIVPLLQTETEIRQKINTPAAKIDEYTRN